MQPLSGVRVVELAALGPVPWCGMLLAGLGAQVIRIERPSPPGAARAAHFEFTDRGCHRVALDLKSAQGLALALRLVERADALMEGMRPGVAERLGLGPRACHAINPKLVYARMTGWGQHGPLAQRAGHDINYLALSGALHAIGARDGPPAVPLNLVADLGGGGAFLAIGLLAALLDARGSGAGSVLDVAMVDGVANLMALPYARLAAGLWRDERGSNLLDGGTPWYGVYETADAGYMAVGAIEPAFYEAFVRGLGLDPAALPDRADRAGWPELRRRFAAAFRQAGRDEWQRRFEDVDACVTPVLSMTQAPQHAHHRARRTFVARDGALEPAPAPRCARPGARVEAALPPVPSRADSRALLRAWGLSAAETEVLLGCAAAGRAGEVPAA
ncbi:MAG: CoA transferase [Pseudomonadota bacterium]|nr:CoA transferase [Rubrivivax sp.]